MPNDSFLCHYDDADGHDARNGSGRDAEIFRVDEREEAGHHNIAEGLVSKGRKNLRDIVLDARAAGRTLKICVELWINVLLRGGL